MHVFVTGGTGTIGSAVVAELLGHGHTVLGLARSDDSAATLDRAGAGVLRGSLADLDVLRDGAAQADGVVSLAFGRDYSSADALAAAIVEESAAMAALGEALIDSGHPIVTVSGTPWVPGRASTETDQVPTDGPVGERGRSQIALLALASRGVRASAVRMPRTVHHEGRGGFAGLLTDQARRSGVAGYPGDGTQRWPAVHALDAAVLIRLALEAAPAGSAWHAVADEGDAVRGIAAVVGRRLGLPVEQVPQEDFGPFGPIFAMDQPSSSAHPRGPRVAAHQPEPARGPGEPPALTGSTLQRRVQHDPRARPARGQGARAGRRRRAARTPSAADRPSRTGTRPPARSSYALGTPPAWSPAAATVLERGQPPNRGATEPGVTSRRQPSAMPAESSRPNATRCRTMPCSRAMSTRLPCSGSSSSGTVRAA